MPTKTRTYLSQYEDLPLPVYGLGAGVAASSMAAFAGTPIRVPVLTPDEQTDFDLVFQLPHGMEFDIATITVHPHVHWTAVDSPTKNQLLYWDFYWTWAPAARTVAAANSFYPVQSVSTTVCTLSGNEYLRHLVTEFDEISWPATGQGPDTVYLGKVQISSLSTVGAGVIGFLSFDVHFWKGPNGTDDEW